MLGTMTEAITLRVQHRRGEALDAPQDNPIDLSRFELPEVGSIVIQQDVPCLIDNGRFDLKIPLICKDSCAVLEIEFEDLVQFLSRWSPSRFDCPVSEAVPQILEFLGAHCLPASVRDSRDVVIRDMVPVTIERCATTRHCASLVERMFWSYHLHNCAIGLAYGVCDPLVQDELTQYLESFFEDSRNVALLLC